MPAKKSKIQPFRSVLIYGMGMMGTSLAMTLRKASPHARIACVVRSSSKAKYIEALGLGKQLVINPYLSDSSAVPYGAYELIVLAMGIKQSLNLLPNLPPLQGLITDISSTQAQIASAFQKRPELRFVASHPLCGSEERGAGAARESLFKNRLCLLSSSSKRQSDLKLMESFWNSLGMNSCILSPKEHDKSLALLSHAPHMISSLLCQCLQKDSSVRSLRRKSPITPVGGGIRDMIRIAGSNPEMWADILETNQQNITASLKLFEKELQKVIKDLKTRRPRYWLQWFKKMRNERDKFYDRP